MVGAFLAGTSSAQQIGALLWQAFYLLFMFALVVLLCVLVTRFWVRKGSPMAAGRGKSLRLLEAMPLGANKGLYLIRVPEAIWLVGVTENGISVLKEYPESLDLPSANAAVGEWSTPDWLSRVWPRRKDTAAVDAHTDTTPAKAFDQELLRRIEQLKGPRE